VREDGLLAPESRGAAHRRVPQGELSAPRPRPGRALPVLGLEVDDVAQAPGAR